MKGCNTNIFFKKGEIECFNELNLNHKIKAKAHDILLKSEKNVKAKIMTFFQKRFKKDINGDQKSVLLNAIKLFNMTSRIVGFV